MLGTVLLCGGQLLILAAFGLAVLAPVRPEVRAKLLPAAPALGAALIAVLSNWTARWLSIRDALPLLVVAAACLVGMGWRLGRRPLAIPRTALVGALVGIGASLGGFALAAAPAVHVADTNAVAPSYSVDEFYFAGVTTWMVDHPLLPGPVMRDAMTGNDTPGVSPAADDVHYRLRFGQSAVAAALSVLVGTAPVATVSSLSLCYLLLLGAAAFAAATYLGLRRRWAAVAACCVTSCFFVVSQPLEGKNDGLLGVSLALVALVLSVGAVTDRGGSWPLVLVGAGLVATYSEFMLLLAPTLLMFALVAPRGSRLHRLNVVSGRWAASALLVPWAWTWLAESFKISTRFTDGPTPFVGRSGLSLLAAYAGIGASPTASVWVLLLLGLAALLVLGALFAGLVVAYSRHDVRALPATFAVVVLVLEARAVMSGSGNLQYRVMQLGLPLLIFFAVVGWSVLWRRSARAAARVRRDSRALRAAGASACVVFVLGNLITVGASTSFARAAHQHIPARVTAEIARFVARVGDSNVTVVAPNLTDTATLSLVLSHEPQVQYASIPASSAYVGRQAHWDRVPDRYYILGPGASVVGGHTTLYSGDGFQIVTLNEDGMIFAPFTNASTWARISWMRGFPCAWPGAVFLMIRGGTGRESFRVAVEGRTLIPARVTLTDESGASTPSQGVAATWNGWAVQTFRAPRTWNSLVALHSTAALDATGTRSFPLLFGATTAGLDFGAVDPILESFCLADRAEGMDGYDREITFMRTP